MSRQDLLEDVGRAWICRCKILTELKGTSYGWCCASYLVSSSKWCRAVVSRTPQDFVDLRLVLPEPSVSSGGMGRLFRQVFLVVQGPLMCSSGYLCSESHRLLNSGMYISSVRISRQQILSAVLQDLISSSIPESVRISQRRTSSAVLLNLMSCSVPRPVRISGRPT